MNKGTTKIISEPIGMNSDLLATAMKGSSETGELLDQSQSTIPHAPDPSENLSNTVAEKDQERKERFKALQARAVSFIDRKL